MSLSRNVLKWVIALCISNSKLYETNHKCVAWNGNLKSAIDLPTSESPDLEDAGVEEITTNPTVTIPSSTSNELQDGRVFQKKLMKSEILNHNYKIHNDVADVEASSDNGKQYSVFRKGLGTGKGYLC